MNSAKGIIPPIVTGIVLILLWEAITRVTNVSPGMFPPPREVFGRWAELLSEREYYLSIAETVRTMFAGLGLGAAFGIPLGVAGGMSPLTRAALWPYVQGLRALPAVALIPVVLALLPREVGRPVLIGIACGAIIAVSCGDGIRSTARERLNFAATANLRGWRVILLLYLPEVARELFVGLRIAASLALILSVILEMLLGQLHGLGTYISTLADTDRGAVFAVVLTLAVIGVLVNAGIDCLSKAVVFWEL